MDKSLIGKQVSVLITGKEGKQENYIGIVQDITKDGFMVLDPNNSQFMLEKIIFRLALIQSIWVYRKLRAGEQDIPFCGNTVKHPSKS